MDNELPSEFDLIVVGTGLTESIVSAAASRIGKSVLHIDSNDYYGEQWASFNFKSLHNCTFSNNIKKHTENSSDLLNFNNDSFNIRNFSAEWHVPEKIGIYCKNDDSKNRQIESVINDSLKLEENNENSVFLREEILNNSRKFNIDLMPKLHFARGDFIELLISSNIARYAEYKSVSRILTWLNNQIEAVPCSRSDVFANNKVSVIEKRILMKLLSLVDKNDNTTDSKDKTFLEFLKSKKLTTNLIHFVLYAISQGTDSTSCIDGMANTKRFLNSLGRFGKTPFLFSMYGSGETTQAFCRLSAVFGGIFALNQPIAGLKLDNNRVTSLLNGSQEIKAEHFVLNIEKAPVELVNNLKVTDYISRAVLITNRSIMPSEQEHLTLLIYPPEDKGNSVTLIEMGHLTGTCPQNFYLVHLITKQQSNPKDDFKHVVANLFESNYTHLQVDGKPNMLWACYFSIPNTSDLKLNDNDHLNVHLCDGPDLDLDYDYTVKKAKDIFQRIYPDIEFLPRAPDPDEIIFGEEEQSKLNDVCISETPPK